MELGHFGVSKRSMTGLLIPSCHQILNKLPAAVSEPEAHLALAAPGISYHSIRKVT
jgi:hypothetical protein